MEARMAERTWFVTLTFANEDLARYKTISDYLKRVRKAGTQVRFMAVLEHGGKGNRRHFHLLCHGDKALQRRDITLHWKHGISHARLAKPKDFRYVAKYATKEHGERVRASKYYGIHKLRLAMNHLVPFFLAFPNGKISGFQPRDNNPGRTVLPRKVLRTVERTCKVLAALERERISSEKEEYMRMRKLTQLDHTPLPFLGGGEAAPEGRAAGSSVSSGDPR